jgi:hypothetical protein
VSAVILHRDISKKMPFWRGDDRRPTMSGCDDRCHSNGEAAPAHVRAGWVPGP